MSSRRERFSAVLIVFGIAVALFWQIMARRTTRPFAPFHLTAAAFETFTPAYPGYGVASMAVTRSAVEPNLAAYLLTPGPSAPAGLSPILVRLAHGYNVRDCMRHKDYEVALVEDAVQTIRDPESAIRVQLWRMTSPSGATFLWATSLLRADDFSPHDMDVRSLPFPSIGLPVEPGWVPTGLSWRGLRHPVRNLRMYVRGMWNNSRRDVLTLLRLRQPVWASDEILTLVSIVPTTAEAPEPRPLLLSIHMQTQKKMMDWQAGQGSPASPPVPAAPPPP